MGMYAKRTPDWYIQPKEQIDRVREFLWRNGDIWKVPNGVPQIPSHYQPVTSGELLMLGVYLDAQDRTPGSIMTARRWWEFIEPPDGYSKLCELEFDPELMKLADGIEYRSGIRWIGIDPYANSGASARFLWENPDEALQSKGIWLAGPELFMAVGIFPGYKLSWNGTNMPSPNAAGYQLRTVADPRANPRARAPYLCRDDKEKCFKLSSAKAEEKGPEWGSPTFRDLEFAA